MFPKSPACWRFCGKIRGEMRDECCLAMLTVTCNNVEMVEDEDEEVCGAMVE